MENLTNYKLEPLENLIPETILLSHLKIKIGLISFEDVDAINYMEHILIVQCETDRGPITEVFILNDRAKEQSSILQILFWTIDEALVYLNNAAMYAFAEGFDFKDIQDIKTKWQNYEDTFLRFCRLKLDQDALEEISDALEEMDADK